MTAFTVGSLFAGMGGFATGFRRAGFALSWANEIDKAAVKTYQHNHPESKMFADDVRNFSPARLGWEAPDVLTAGFPCQPFSAAGERLGLDDDRGMLYAQICRIVKEYGPDRPKMLLLENVSNLQGHDGGRSYSKIESDLKESGYWILPHNVALLNTRSHTDIPHNRERIFIVALSTSWFKGGRFRFPESVEEAKPLQSFFNTAERAEDYYYFDIENNRYGAMIWEAVEKGNRNSVYQLRRSYVREYKTIMPTLTANMGDGGHNVPVIVDSWGLRKLTPQECARFQGFEGEHASLPPDISRPQAYKQIGNSVTIPLVERLALACVELLEDKSAVRRKI